MPDEPEYDWTCGATASGTHAAHFRLVLSKTQVDFVFIKYIMQPRFGFTYVGW